MVEDLQNSFRISCRRACRVLQFNRSSRYYKSKADWQAELRMRIKDIASTRVRYGYRRIHVLLKREGWQVNHNRVYRIYCEEGLNLRIKKPKKRRVAVCRVPRDAVGAVNDC